MDAGLIVGKRSSRRERYVNDLVLGSDSFVEDAQCKMDADQSLKGIPKPQKLALPKPLDFYVKNYPKDEAMARAYLSGHYTLAAEVGEAFRKSYATVSRSVKAFEARARVEF